MKYTEQEIKELIEKEYKNWDVVITETEGWLKVVSHSGSFTNGKEVKKNFKQLMREEFLKNNPFKTQTNEK
jgi:hypothetical protein